MRSMVQSADDLGDRNLFTTEYQGRERRVAESRHALEGPGYHVTMRLSDDRVIAPNRRALCLAARVLMSRGRRVTLLAFRVADTHLHVLVACSQELARRFAHYAAVALHRVLRLPVPFEPTRVRSIVDQRHLYSSFRYVLRQDSHHGIASDPAHDGSSLPDVLGMRVLGTDHAQTVRMTLPRLDRRELAASLGITFAPADTLPPRLLPTSAAAAVGLADLKDRSKDAVLARRAAVHAAAELLSTSTLSDELRTSPRTIQRLREQDVDALVVRAVQLQWRFRASLLERSLLSP